MTHLRKDVFPRIAEHICMIGLHVANCPSAFEAPSTDRVPFSACFRSIVGSSRPNCAVAASTPPPGITRFETIFQ